MVRSAAKKKKTAFVCQSCGHSERKWLGRCPTCHEWSSLVEELQAPLTATEKRLGIGPARPMKLRDIEELPVTSRLTSGIQELDRVLGGGLVAGSLVLLGGEPGIGKSTLLCQLMAGVSQRCQPRPLLYISGEESIEQTALRSRRVGAVADDLIILAETDIDRILSVAAEIKPAMIALDSIQTAHTPEIESIAGSVGQIRASAAAVLKFAKSTGTPAILVGHVTKDGQLAGPKALEHVVDVVLQFEGEGGSPYRILRALKNRFGSTQEVGVFEMKGSGLAEVENPSALFLAERPVGAPGSVVVASADGTRPILVEVQALVAPASAGVGRRTAAGVDSNRLALLLAVLAQRARCDVISRDVFINVAGGIRISEPAIDLGVVAAIASSARSSPIDSETVVFGEVGLSGEVRAVNLADARLNEARKLGFKRCILPRLNEAQLESIAGIKVVGVSSVAEALAALQDD